MGSGTSPRPRPDPLSCCYQPTPPHNGVTDPARLRHGVSRASVYLRRRGRPNAFPLTQPCVLHVGYRAISSGLLREVLEVGGGQL